MHCNFRAIYILNDLTRFSNLNPIDKLQILVLKRTLQRMLCNAFAIDTSRHTFFNLFCKLISKQ